MDSLSFSYLPTALVVDVHEIDLQHANLFEQLAALKSACVDHNAYMPLEAEALFLSLVEHCETEERLARAAGLDFLRHGEKHRAMLHSIRKRLDDMERPEADVFGLIRYVEYWFERHITEEDKGLGESLRQSAFLEVGQQVADEFLEQGNHC